MDYSTRQIREWTVLDCQGRAASGERAVDRAVRLLADLEEAGCDLDIRQELTQLLDVAFKNIRAGIDHDLEEENMASDIIGLDRSELDAVIARLAQ